MKNLDFECFRIRYIERWIAEQYPNQQIRCPVHLSVGQEAIAVGVCAALDPNDVIFSTHRCHAHYLAKGGSLSLMLGELLGLQSGCCGGRGGSMHLMDPDAGVAWSGPIVGSAVPLAVGLADAFEAEGSKRRVVCFLGDAALEEGVVFESLNYAALRHLPILFVVEDNGMSVNTPDSMRRSKHLLSGVSWLVYRTFGDDDVRNVYKMTLEGILPARCHMMHIVTQRLSEHCGPDIDGKALNSTQDEQELVWATQVGGEIEMALLEAYRRHEAISKGGPKA